MHMYIVHCTPALPDEAGKCAQGAPLVGQRLRMQADDDFSALGLYKPFAQKIKAGRRAEKPCLVRHLKAALFKLAVDQADGLRKAHRISRKQQKVVIIPDVLRDDGGDGVVDVVQQRDLV